MSLYNYKGVDTSGKNVNGVIDADSQKVARQKLKQKGVFATAIEEKGAAKIREKKHTLSVSFGNKVKGSDITMMTRQFATLMNANVPIVDTLDALSEQVESEKLKVILSEVKQKVNEGGSIGDSLKPYADIFGNLYVNMIKAGEASGTLGVVLDRLADYTEKQSRFKSKLMSSLTYPILMVCIGIIIIIVLFVVVIPKITTIFESMETTLPIYTQILIDVSKFLSEEYLPLAFFAFMTFFLSRKFINSSSGREKWDGLKLKLPILGKIVRMVAVSQFTSTLATLQGAGVPLLQAMEIVSNVVTNVVIKKELIKAKEAVSEGQALGATLSRSGQFPPIVIHMITVGEKTGELEKMLQHVSNAYENEVEVKVEALTSLLEPVMLIFMGGGVGFIVMAIMMPIMQMSQMAG